MRLLIDSDVFCKLGVGGLLDDAIAVLDTRISECGRLPALPYMLRRGKLPKVYGPDACGRLVPVAESIRPIPAPDAAWLDKTAAVPNIDPGEAQLFAYAAQDAMLVLSGDKRALIALKDIEGFPEALAGRIVIFEAILLALCDRLGSLEVRQRLGSLIATDKTLKICFSAGNPDPREALASYHRDLSAEVRPLILWNPQHGGTE